MKHAVTIAITLCLGAPAALAKPSTTVFPLTAPNLPMRIASAPDQFSKALAEELDGKVAPLPIDDAAGLQGCDPEATTCLESVSKAYKSKRIVFGAIAMLDDKRLKVTLTRFDPGPDRQQRSFTVEGNVDEMAAELVKLSRPLFDGSEPEPEDVRKPPPIVEEPIVDPGDRKPGEVSGGTKTILTLGGISAAIGGGFLIWSYSIASSIKDFKPKTTEDFRYLTSREDRGQQVTIIGGVALGVGAVLIGYGVYRLFDERSKPAETLSRITPVPLEGGAALVYSMELP